MIRQLFFLLLYTATALPAIADDAEFLYGFDSVNGQTWRSAAEAAAAVDHDSTVNFLATEHVDWAAPSAGTIHATNYAAGSGDMAASTYDPAGITEQLVGLVATQTLTNKTLNSSTNDIHADSLHELARNETGLYVAEIRFHIDDPERTHDKLTLAFESGNRPGLVRWVPGNLRTWFQPERVLDVGHPLDSLRSGEDLNHV